MRNTAVAATAASTTAAAALWTRRTTATRTTLRSSGATPSLMTPPPPPPCCLSPARLVLARPTPPCRPPLSLQRLPVLSAAVSAATIALVPVPAAVRWRRSRPTRRRLPSGRRRIWRKSSLGGTGTIVGRRPNKEAAAPSPILLRFNRRIKTKNAAFRATVWRPLRSARSKRYLGSRTRP